MRRGEVKEAVEFHMMGKQFDLASRPPLGATTKSGCGATMGDHVILTCDGRPTKRRTSASRGVRAARAVVCLVGAVAACAAISRLGLPAGIATGGDVLLSGWAKPRASEGGMIKEEASEETDRREHVAMQAETLRAALRAMRAESPPEERAELDAARSELKKGAEDGSAAGLAALQDARAVLSQVIGGETARDQALGGGTVRLAAAGLERPARLQKLTSQELSVPDNKQAWRERYMDRYAACWPHCAPEANILNTMDPTKYPYNEEAGGHRWTAWKIGHSGINAAYAQAERKYFNEGSRIRSAANADHVYPNDMSFKAAGATTLLGHAEPARPNESRAAYERRLARKYREQHPYKPLHEGLRGAWGTRGSAGSSKDVATAPHVVPSTQMPRQQMMEAGAGSESQSASAGDSDEAASTPGYQWTGKGGQEETNVWSTEYLRRTSANYYGDKSGRAWAWKDDSAKPTGYYYNVFDHGNMGEEPEDGAATASDATADGQADGASDGDAPPVAESIGDRGSRAMPSLKQQEAAAREIVQGRLAPLTAQEARQAAYDIADPDGHALVAPHPAAGGPAAQQHKAATKALAQVHQLAQRKKAASRVHLPAPVVGRHAAASHEGAGDVKMAKIGINTGGDVISDGDVRVPAPGGGVVIGQMFKSRGQPSSLAETAAAGEGGEGGAQATGSAREESLAMQVPTLPLSNYYATGGDKAPINTPADLPPVSFVAAPYGGSASVAIPVYRRTPADPWAAATKAATPADRARTNAAEAQQATASAQAATAFVAASVGEETPASEEEASVEAEKAGENEAEEAGSSAGAEAAAAAAPAEAQGEVSSEAAGKAVGGLQKMGLAVRNGLATAKLIGRRPGAGAQLSVGPSRAGQAGVSGVADVAHDGLVSGGGVGDRRSQLLTNEMKVAGFMAAQQASRMSRTPPQPVVGVGQNRFILSIAPGVEPSELSGVASGAGAGTDTGVPSLKERGAQGL